MNIDSLSAICGNSKQTIGFGARLKEKAKPKTSTHYYKNKPMCREEKKLKYFVPRQKKPETNPSPYYHSILSFYDIGVEK